jgi:outer membrane autotransporter protein
MVALRMVKAGSAAGKQGSRLWRRGLKIAAAAFALGVSAAVLAGSTGPAQAQAMCKSPIPLPPALAWVPGACGAAISTATGATTALTTVDIAFLTQSSAFIGTPGNPQPNQMGSGFWIRGVGGQNTVSATGTATTGLAPGLSVSANTQTRMDFGGFQVGADIGRFNLGASGLNIIFGVTGGLLDARAQDLSGSGTFTFNVPFVGGYAAATLGNFFADLLVREDFYSESVTAPVFGLAGAGVNGNALNVTGSTGYHFDVGRIFVEPSVGFVWSQLNLASLNALGATVAFPGAPGPVAIPTGVYTINPVQSVIGRAGVRVGTTVQGGGIGWQPFAAASVWNEFAPNATSTFLCNDPVVCGPAGAAVNLSTTRVGTFEQFGLGTAAQILNTGWLGFVRVDYRTGANIQGWDLTGGLRYQFLWDSLRPALITK